jgi:hypothetical protein
MLKTLPQLVKYSGKVLNELKDNFFIKLSVNDTKLKIIY